MTPTATALATAFGLGCATSPVERMAEGWGGHNVLWRLRTTAGRWAIKQLGREIGPAPDAALAIESAAYAGGVPMPRPVPTVTGSCVAAIDGTRYRCHEWVDGTALAWTPAWDCRGRWPDSGGPAPTSAGLEPQPRADSSRLRCAALGAFG